MHRDLLEGLFHAAVARAQPALAIEPLLSYHLIAGLRVFAGAHLDLMLGGSYHQREEIISPGEIRFENDSRLRGVYDGDLPNEARLHAAVVAGLMLLPGARAAEPVHADGRVQGLVDQRQDEWWPKPEEKRFDQIGWVPDLRTARKLAVEHNRPVFLFTMDGRVNLGRC